MNRDKREMDYPTELESQFILRLPEEPAKVLNDVLKSGENLKNRLSIQIENDMRHGEVRFDHWLMHAKIVDLPTIIESLKTIDNKSFYKSADICQMMLCKFEPDQPEEESPSKTKKKDPYKVDKKFLYPHGITPPTKNVRKRRFRKTLKKKNIEAPEIEKEVKRLLRADNEAVSVTWEVIQEDEEQQKPETKTPAQVKSEKKKSAKSTKKEAVDKQTIDKSNVVDIFGGAVSDSDNEEETRGMDDSGMSQYSRMSDSMQDKIQETYPFQFEPQMFQKKDSNIKMERNAAAKTEQSMSQQMEASGSSRQYDEEDSRDNDNMAMRIEQVKAELDELKERRQRTQHGMEGIENLALKQRFQEVLHTLNQDIMFKEMEYQGLITLHTSEDI
ncbi:transcription initiation factor TFIID subunit 7 [Leptidea sinapis]|uniref:transcription initiation factor TFIID subunit 7 n=1 Tax=Leptidea sinapis TaxID=189913 RepID=UPI0021C2C044|nr:transcription initiation factor TFIID subunit 7 [Leptidea sinapis]